MNFHSIRCIMKLVVCFISPRQRLGDIKHTTRFIIHRMEWKFIWDPICMWIFLCYKKLHTAKLYSSESNSYHKTSLSVSFGCWHLSGIPLSPLHFTVYTIAWQRKFEPQWVLNTDLCILNGWKVKYQPFSLRVY